MRTIICASCAVLALVSHQKPAHVYQSAVATYVAGDRDAAFDLLRPLQPRDVQDAIRASVNELARGDTQVARRLEAMAMLHSEFALFGHLDERDVSSNIEMAHRALTPDRFILERKDATGAEIPEIRKDDPRRLEREREEQRAQQRAREFLTRWSAFSVSVLLTYGKDVEAATIAAETLKLVPDNPALLYWHGIAMEFRAVWVGAPVSDPHADTAMPRWNGPGPDPLTNTRIWAPVEDAYRRALQRDSAAYEAHLHLGYALEALHRYGDAAMEYETARKGSTDPFVVYVADLLLARLEENQNDQIGAVADYERALEALPGAQSAYVGLGSLEARRGNAQRARELTMRLAAIPEKQQVDDPWWAFHTVRVPTDDLHWLRATVRP